MLGITDFLILPVAGHNTQYQTSGDVVYNCI